MDLIIPKEIKVGGLVYKVEVVDELEDASACAKVSFPKLKIKIEKGEPRYMQQVFIHEVLHAINGEWPDERIEFLAMALYAFIVQNPDVFRGGK